MPSDVRDKLLCEGVDVLGVGLLERVGAGLLEGVGASQSFPAKFRPQTSRKLLVVPIERRMVEEGWICFEVLKLLILSLEVGSKVCIDWLLKGLVMVSLVSLNLFKE